MQITGAESQVMDALWREGPMTADAIVAALSVEQGWGEATIKTLVHRLLRKAAIVAEREAGVHRYRPLVERSDYVQAESQGLLDRLFDGQLTPMVAHFAEHRKLHPDEIARLKALIEALDDDA